MPFIAIGVGLLGGVLLGVISGAYLQQRITQRRIAASERSAARILNEAERRQKEILLEAKEDALRFRQQAEAELKERRKEVQRLERRITQKEENLDRKLESLEQRQRNLQNKEAQLEEARSELQEIEEQRKQELERVSSLTAGEAKEMLLAQVEREIRDEANRRLREIEQEMKEEADERGRKIIAVAMQRLTGDVVSQTTTSVVPLPSEDMKGRIIGREGRNIRALELATGVDVIIDDTPDAVTLSGFDPVRREIARVALTKLLTDGRIHPARIEEMVEKARQEVDEVMVQAAEEVLYELGIHQVHPEIVKTLGRLKFRTSYGQNQLQHAREVALLAGGMAAEMGLDVAGTKRAGLLHDVGKGLTHEHEGTHVELGYRLCKKHGEPELVLNAIRAHHDEEPHFFAETFLVTAGDAISGSRPGARREMFEGYVKRLEKLEEIAMEHPGVERCFAIQAGRELRVMVEPEKVSDADMAQLSEAVARTIEEELQYPGQIKVVVVRETRTVDFAR